MTYPPRDERRREALTIVARALGPVRNVTAVPTSEGRAVRALAGDADVVIRIGRARTPRSSRSREIVNHVRAAEAGFAPPLLWGDVPSGVVVVAWLSGASPLPAPPRALGPARIAAVARRLAALHAGPAFEGELDPRRTLEAAVGGGGRRAPLRIVPPFRRRLERLARRLPARCGERVPVHGDPHPGNWLSRGEELWLVDFEFAAMGPRAWDLAEFAATAGLDGIEERRLLDAYAAAAGRAPVEGPREWRAWRVAVDVVGAAWAFREAAETGVGAWRRYGRWRLRRAQRVNARLGTAPGRWRGST